MKEPSILGFWCARSGQLGTSLVVGAGSSSGWWVSRTGEGCAESDRHKLGAKVGWGVARPRARQTYTERDCIAPIPAYFVAIWIFPDLIASTSISTITAFNGSASWPMGSWQYDVVQTQQREWRREWLEGSRSLRGCCQFLLGICLAQQSGCRPSLPSHCWRGGKRRERRRAAVERGVQTAPV